VVEGPSEGCRRVGVVEFGGHALIQTFWKVCEYAAGQMSAIKSIPDPSHVDPSLYSVSRMPRAPEPITVRLPTLQPGRRTTRSAIIAENIVFSTRTRRIN
jgi:hypothetical protein